MTFDSGFIINSLTLVRTIRILQNVGANYHKHDLFHRPMMVQHTPTLFDGHKRMYQTFVLSCHLATVLCNNENKWASNACNCSNIERMVQHSSDNRGARPTSLVKFYYSWYEE